MKNKDINLNIKNWSGKNFHLSDISCDSDFTDKTIKIIEGKELEFYLISEIKGTLDIEGEGSSRKIIKDLISGKRKPKNNNEQKAINLYSAMSFIRQTKPRINKNNLMLIYNILKTDIDMQGNDLENDLDYRQSDDEGYINDIKTPSIPVMRKGMEDLFEFINSDLLKEAAVEKGLLIQVIFIYFHPFYDFNGRTGRLMTFWYLTVSGYGTIANSIYMALPSNKKKYIKMFESLRKFKWSDLTTFLTFLKCITAYGVVKTQSLSEVEKTKGVSFNSSEKLIMFYLIDVNGWSLVNNLELKIDLGISKQGIHNTIASLERKGVVKTKKQSNKLFVISKQYMINKDYAPLKYFYAGWAKDMTRGNLTLETAFDNAVSVINHDKYEFIDAKDIKF